MEAAQTKLAIEALKAAGCGVLAIHVESRIAELEKENASLKQDAARLDYMIDNQAYVEYECDNFWLEYADGTGQSTDHKSAREAIDAAMKKD